MTWITGYQKWLSESDSLKNAQLIVNYLSGWTPESISAMCGNMRHESSINPDMYEYGYTWEQDRGYGLVQWTPRSKYWDWAVQNNFDPYDGYSQLKRIEYELNNNIQYYPTTSYPETFKEFTQSKKSIDYLTNAFCWNYERPNQTAGEDSMPKRIEFAYRVYNELLFGGGQPFPVPGEELEKEVHNKLYHLWLSQVLRW